MTQVSPKELEFVRALIALAANDATPETEAKNAALQAARRIHKHDLLSVEAIAKAKADAEIERAYAEEERARGEGARGPSGVMTRIDVLLLVMSETSQAYRFARLCPDFKQQGMPVIGWIKKKFINQTIWATPDTARRYSGAGRRVVEAIIVPQEVASQVREVVTGVRA